ncbi:MAG: prepilin-type N-terminal cleavage/methylation domain-containing protein [Tepidisphaera sp.]
MHKTSRHPRSSGTSRGFTLVECICAITVIGVVSAVVLPVINSATTSYVNAARARDVSENVAFAMDRCVNLLRDAPMKPGTADLDILSASSTSIRLSDNHAISFAGGVLSITSLAGVTAPLLRDVESFSIGYFAQDGFTSTLASPESTWICVIRIKSSDFELSQAAFLRHGDWHHETTTPGGGDGDDDGDDDGGDDHDD